MDALTMNSKTSSLKVVMGDITTLDVDAIVNAANTRMLGGGGVDGAIHRAAGPELYGACLQVKPVHTDIRCPTGQARITPGFKLKANHVIHTVGPVWHGGAQGEAALLESCYRNCMALAHQNAIRSIAFPCISTGVYGYPKAEAATLATTTLQQMRQGAQPMNIVFCCFNQDDAQHYQKLLANQTHGPSDFEC